MDDSNIICPKCQSKMEEGFILDQAHGANLVSHWVKGSPEKSIWTGTKTRNKETLAVQTYCCSQCGYLESYAHQSQE